MTGHLKVRDQRTGAITTVSTKLFRATFNHGKIEETFFALNDSHASEVAHEIAARRRLLFDAVQRVDKEETTPKAECAAWPEARCTR